MVLVEVLIPCYMSQVDRSHLSLTGGVYLVSSLYTVQNCTTTASPLINKYFISKQVHKYLSVVILLLYKYLHLSCTYALSTPGSGQPPHHGPTHASSQPPVCVSVPSVLVCLCHDGVSIYLLVLETKGYPGSRRFHNHTKVIRYGWDGQHSVLQPPVPYDPLVSIQISHLLTVGSMSVYIVY